MSDDPFKDANESAKALGKLLPEGYRKLDKLNLNNEDQNKMKVLLNDISSLLDRVKTLKR